MELLAKNNVGRDINRHDYNKAEINAYLERLLIKNLKQLMLFRNTHLAFEGTFYLLETADSKLHIKSNNQDWAVLKLDLAQMSLEIKFSEGDKIVDLFNATMQSATV